MHCTIEFIGHGNVGPYGLVQLLLGNQPPGILGEVAQYIERLGPQRDILVACAQASARQIEREAVKPQNLMDDLVHLALVVGEITIRSEKLTRKIILLSPLHQELGAFPRL